MVQLLICALLAGTSSPLPDGTQTDHVIEAAKDTVKRVLKDPDSAQFRDVTKVTNSVGEDAVCGQVNARNSYGGYVGFEPFGVGAVGYSKDPAELERMGCLGPEVERRRREQDGKDNVVKRFDEEAEFNCNVIWTLMENHIRHGESAEVVLDAAMTATINRIQQNGGVVQPAMLQAIRDQYAAGLAQTAQDKQASRSIKRGDSLYKMQFLTGCRLQTVQALKVQAGIQ